MLQSIKQLSPAIKSSVVYTISNVVSKGLVFLTIPIFTRLMKTEQIGVVNLYASWYSMICVVASLSLTAGGFQVAMKDYPNRRDQYQSSVLTLTSLFSVFFIMVFCISPSFWSNILKLPVSLIHLMLFGFLVYPARDIWLARQRYEYKYKLPGVVIIGSSLLASIFSVLAVYIAKDRGYQETAIVRLLANYLIMYGVAGILATSIFIKGKTFYNKEFWLFSLALSIPLIGNSLATQVLNLSDRVMIRHFVGEREVGIYGTIFIVSSISQLVWSSINASFVPYLFENLDNPQKRTSIKVIAKGFMFAYAGIAFAITLLAPEIIRIMATPEYLEAVCIMPPIAAGIFMISLSNLYTNVLIYHKKTQYVMIATVIAAITNVLLNYICIPCFGYMVAAYTTLVAHIVLAFFQYIVSNRVHSKMCPDDHDIVYDNKVMLMITGLALLVCLVCVFLYFNTILRYIVIASIAGCFLILKNRIIAVVRDYAHLLQRRA